MPLLCALIVGGLFGTSQAQAGGFMVPTTNTAGWGRAMAGGSLFPNDPSAAFNNPAAMAFIDKRIAQLTINYADIDIKYLFRQRVTRPATSTFSNWFSKGCRV
ncbi:outer membrane protein transport protein, partial [Pseudomonas aeruginosa]|uniref:outer membrane protein transport protein n=1 Tax=Pseudomonas aeruginosa TaxID=287 RepID=UPI003968198F